jgi:hypothetical protein
MLDAFWLSAVLIVDGLRLGVEEPSDERDRWPVCVPAIWRLG